MKQRDLTRGSVAGNLLWFSLPYLLSCFLQTFYGLADLFIAGQFNGASTISAVAVGSQVLHMLTVVLVGLAMGTTVSIGRAVGAKDEAAAGRAIGSTLALFSGVAAGLTALLLASTRGILAALSVPPEAWSEARQYLMICFAGVPFITAYNVISGIYRGMGDSRSPMVFVAIAGVINIGLDWLLIGPLRMGAAGAALATVFSQGVSVALALVHMLRARRLPVRREHLRPHRAALSGILQVGLPVACQDGFIQIAFLVITVIANRRGVDVAAAVGIVEKFISFVFLVPSAMLSSVSAIAAQNAGAGQHRRARQTLFCAMGISVAFGLAVAILCQWNAAGVLRLFAREEPRVIELGAQYLRAYIFDCAFASVHFCFSGFFCAYRRSLLSFAHNLASVLLVRIPGAWLASVRFPDTLYPMGWAAPLGSLLSALLCAAFYAVLRRKGALD